MAVPAYNAQPEREVVAIELKDAGVQLKTWISYRYNEHFLTPSDAFSFTIGDEHVDDVTAAALVPGASVTLVLNGNVQSTGYIDTVEKRANRSGGTEWTIGGRDKLGQAVDSGIDPRTQFKPTQTLADFLKTVYGPFGWSTDSAFVIENGANRGVLTGQKRGTPTSKKGKELKKFAIHQLRPYAREGAHEFASRVCQRKGLWIWPTADGTQLVVGTPDFEQSPMYTLQRRIGGTNNILDGSVRFDVSNQPNVIVADGFGGGGEFGHSRLRAYLANPAVALGGDQTAASAAYQALFAKFKSAHALTAKHSFYTVNTPTLRVMYLHDDESKTQEELDNFVYREMALRMRQGLTVHYTVEGHGQYALDGSFTPWAVDTVVDVQDDIGGVHEPMWVLSRTFNKSRHSGTTTELELIRLYSLEF